MNPLPLDGILMNFPGCSPGTREDLVYPYNLLLERSLVGLHIVQTDGFLRMWGILLPTKQKSGKNLPVVIVEAAC